MGRIEKYDDVVIEAVRSFQNVNHFIYPDYIGRKILSRT